MENFATTKEEAIVEGVTMITMHFFATTLHAVREKEGMQMVLDVIKDLHESKISLKMTRATMSTVIEFVKKSTSGSEFEQKIEFMLKIAKMFNEMKALRKKDTEDENKNTEKEA